MPAKQALPPLWRTSSVLASCRDCRLNRSSVGWAKLIPKNAWDRPVAALAVSYVLSILLLPIALYLMRLCA